MSNRSRQSIVYGGLVLFTGLVLYFLFWPVPVDPVAWNPPPNPGLKGPYETNTRLKNADAIAVPGRGPEDVLVDGHGRIVTGVEDGRILRLAAPEQPGDPVTLATTKGRPLGLAPGPDGSIYVADAKQGLLGLDGDGTLRTLVSSKTHPELNLANAVAVGPDGNVYFTNSSSSFDYGDITLAVIDHRADGQLLRYDPDSKTTAVILDDLVFPNGLEVDPDRNVLYLNEMGTYRILEIDLSPTDPSIGVFAKNLPGFPDNLHLGPEKLWVGFATPRNDLLDALGPYPVLRSMILRLPAVLRPAATRHGLIAAFGPDGTLRHNLQDRTGRVAFTAGAVPVDDRILLTSYREPVLRSISVPESSR